MKNGGGAKLYWWAKTLLSVSALGTSMTIASVAIGLLPSELAMESLQLRSNAADSILKIGVIEVQNARLKKLPMWVTEKPVRKVTLNSERKAIALTFDDGPEPEVTEKILDILALYNVKATFFVVGRNVERHPDIAKRIAYEGHAIGNHSWSHSYRFHYPVAAAKEIDRTDAIITKTTGIKSFLFRPPGGILKNGLANAARKKNHAIVMWSADPQDYHSKATPKVLIDDLLKYTKPGGIVLLHDGGRKRTNTIDALPDLILELYGQGYEFVTVPELLAMKEQELQEAQQVALGKTAKP